MKTDIGELMSGAKFSEDHRYRYALWRFWNLSAAQEGTAKAAMFIMANPSVAGQYYDDPTVIKCAKYAQRWGYDGLFIGNLYAIVATHYRPWQQTEEEAIGEACDEWLAIMRDSSALHVAAWGFMGRLHADRAERVVNFFPELYHLGLSNDGQPKHPLYLSAELEPILWDKAKEEQK